MDTIEFTQNIIKNSKMRESAPRRRQATSRRVVEGVARPVSSRRHRPSRAMNEGIEVDTRIPSRRRLSESRMLVHPSRRPSTSLEERRMMETHRRVIKKIAESKRLERMMESARKTPIRRHRMTEAQKIELRRRIHRNIMEQRMIERHDALETERPERPMRKPMRKPPVSRSKAPVGRKKPPQKGVKETTFRGNKKKYARISEEDEIKRDEDKGEEIEKDIKKDLEDEEDIEDENIDEEFEESIDDVAYYCDTCHKHFLATADMDVDEIECPVCEESGDIIRIGSAAEVVKEENEDNEEEIPDEETEDTNEEIFIDEDEFSEGLNNLARKHLGKGTVKVQEAVLDRKGNIVIRGKTDSKPVITIFKGFKENVKNKSFVLLGKSSLLPQLMLKAKFIKEGKKFKIAECSYRFLKESKTGSKTVCKGILG